MHLFDLSGNRALVTGGARGLGRGIAQGLKEAGATVAIIARSEGVHATARQDGFLGVQADLSCRDELRRGFGEAVDGLGGLDVLVLSHGIQRRHKSEQFPIEDWDLVLETNLNSFFLLSQMAGSMMLAQGRGKIVMVSSLLAFQGGITVPAYAASKGGVAQLTKALANEWAGRGVNVNAIAPGYMNTEMNEALINNPARNQQILDRIPAGRWGQSEDMKGAAVFLASDASDYISGVIIPVDGGWMGR
jgi:2-deoxy-D-gluconate 3-dehydrogenase